MLMFNSDSLSFTETYNLDYSKLLILYSVRFYKFRHFEKYFLKLYDKISDGKPLISIKV